MSAGTVTMHAAAEPAAAATGRGTPNDLRPSNLHQKWRQVQNCRLQSNRHAEQTKARCGNLTVDQSIKYLAGTGLVDSLLVRQGCVIRITDQLHQEIVRTYVPMYRALYGRFWAKSGPSPA